MKILSRMLSKKIDPEGADFSELDMHRDDLSPEADDSGTENAGRVRPARPLSVQPPAADLSQPVTPKGEEPEVAGSGWGNAEWDEDEWDDDDDWGDDDMDIELRRASADKKQLVSEIRDAMTSVSHARTESVAPPAAATPNPPARAVDEADTARQAKARNELVSPGNEERILEKTETAMGEEGTSRRRSAMAHLKAAAAATKADKILSQVILSDPAGDPEEQSPYRDDLAKVVRPHSTSRPISRVVPRTTTRSPIWDQGEGDEDAALFAAAEDGMMTDPAEGVQDELSAEEDMRMANAPAALTEEDFADDDVADVDDRNAVKSAFPASPFAVDANDAEPESGASFEDVGADDFADDGFEDESFEEADFDDDDDFAPRPSRVVSEAVAFANAPDDEVDTSPPENEVRKKIWEMADEVAAEVAQPTSIPAAGIVDVAAAVSGRAGRGAGRVKTRLLGFQAEEDVAKDVFDENSAGGAASNVPTQFPAGWIVVIDGPGRGACFTLQVGVSQIGRGEEQAVRLDFGDTAISRKNHAAVAYDDEQGKFFLGHGGKSNLVRLNGMPVLSTEELTSGDEVRIGETVLKFVSLCGEGFTWAATGETAAE